LSAYSYYAKIQDYDQDFYSGFHVVVCGLDSIIARRWINGMLISLLTYEDGELDPSRYLLLGRHVSAN
jgi:ubiquitin-activating enzyme E1 C